MAWQRVEGRQREVCPDCGWIDYRHLKVAVAALIEDIDRLLLLERAEDPWKGYWNLPAGYVEADESPEKAVAREVLEETGLDVLALDLVDAYFYDDDPRGNGVLLVYTTQVLTGQLKVNRESQRARYFFPDSLPENLCGAGHREAVEMWILEKQSR
jgi:ADP-ribose pyrophosphatase YjhB (NUDIX family)